MSDDFRCLPSFSISFPPCRFLLPLLQGEKGGEGEWNCGMDLFSEFSRSSPSFLRCFCAIDRGGEGRTVMPKRPSLPPTLPSSSSSSSPASSDPRRVSPSSSSTSSPSATSSSSRLTLPPPPSPSKKRTFPFLFARRRFVQNPFSIRPPPSSSPQQAIRPFLPSSLPPPHHPLSFLLSPRRSHGRRVPFLPPLPFIHWESPPPLRRPLALQPCPSLKLLLLLLLSCCASPKNHSNSNASSPPPLIPPFCLPLDLPLLSQGKRERRMEMPAATAAREGSSRGSSLTLSSFSSPKGGGGEPPLPFPPVSNPPKAKSKTCAYVKA